MGLFGFFKKIFTSPDVQNPESEKQCHRANDCYPDYSYPGTYMARKVITFEERKKSSFPSDSGLYVAEILLLEYCSSGKYPQPENEYPAFWWFEYGIQNVDEKLASLEERGYIEYRSAEETIPSFTIPQLKKMAASLKINVSGKKEHIVSQIVSSVSPDVLSSIVVNKKYKLTQKGVDELRENAYVPYMHKHPGKTIESNAFGPEFNVWSVNRRIANGENWQKAVKDIEAECIAYRKERESKNALIEEELAKRYPEYARIRMKLKQSNEQLAAIQAAEGKYKNDLDVESLILFWENIWANGGLLFNGSKWTFRLPDLYIKQKRFDDAIRILDMIDNPAYQDKRILYMEKIKTKKEKIVSK